MTTSSITGTGDNYYILVDAGSSAYVMANDASHYRPCYKTSLLDTPSITSVTGLSGVEKGEGDFPGGGADSRMDYFWDDED